MLTKVKLGEIAELNNGVNMARSKAKDNSTNSIKVKMFKENVDEHSNKIYLEDVELSKEVNPKYYTKKDDIIFKGSNPCNATQVKDEKYENIILSSRYVLVRPDTEKVNPSFLTHYLNSDIMEAELYKFIEGITFLFIGTNNLKNVTLYLPPLEEQNHFAKLFDLMDKEMNIYNGIINEKRNLKQSIFYKLFEGV